ncbi:SIMPL domain-containing protein [Rhizobium sp. TRM95111]|uniref:SIMPL domain-containing protein n=1 Tax=Rhizobium alarense TaxID=2846851 RepID=UPI001F31EA65|nr:SIMPL domain-containing protein [Rhizobium alarense]MCF3641844.1 SIMPL domain-containing protein [Rhizobium alarense]
MPHFPFGRAVGAGFLALSLAGAAPAAFAQEARPREPVVTVTGVGEASVTPDMALIELGVVKDGKTAREALDANSKAMAEVLSALKEAGIAERDLQTSGFSINPQYHYPQSSTGENQPPVLTGFQVANTVSLRVRDLDKLGTIIDRSVTMGVNQGGAIRFVNDDPAGALSEARRKAVADAMAKAKELTDAAGIGLGRILEIDETVSQPQPMPMMRAMAKDFAAEAVPVAAGENSYSVTVTMTFSLGG